MRAVASPPIITRTYLRARWCWRAGGRASFGAETLALRLAHQFKQHNTLPNQRGSAIGVRMYPAHLPSRTQHLMRLPKPAHERSSVARSARSLFGVAPPMHGLDVFRMVISPGSSHSFRVSVVRYDVATVGKFLCGRWRISLPARRFFDSAASASLLVNGVRDIPWGGADLRCAEHQAEICVLSAPARDRSRTAICGLGSIHSDGVSWDCS